MRTAGITQGARMRERREGLYLSQRELASLADTTVPTIGAYEHGCIPRRRKSLALERVEEVLSQLEAEQGVGAPA